jgi:hypothetical protein
VLGRLDPDFFLGGKMKLDASLAHASVTRLAEQLRLSVEETALAILNTTAANMANATRLLTVDRGLDARDFALIAFGGAGPLHAVDVAQHLEMTRVVVPPHPGLVSALGTLMTDLRVDRARTVMHRSDRLDLPLLSRQLAEVTREALAEIRRDGLKGQPSLIANLSMRYLGQNFGELIKLREPDINQASFDQALEDMHARHEQLFGYAMRGQRIPPAGGADRRGERPIRHPLDLLRGYWPRRHADLPAPRDAGRCACHRSGPDRRDGLDDAAASRQRCEGSRGRQPGHGSERVVRRERGDQGPACAGARPDHTDGGQQFAAQHLR